MYVDLDTSRSIRESTGFREVAGMRQPQIGGMDRSSPCNVDGESTVTAPCAVTRWSRGPSDCDGRTGSDLGERWREGGGMMVPSSPRGPQRSRVGFWERARVDR